METNGSEYVIIKVNTKNGRVVEPPGDEKVASEGHYISSAHILCKRSQGTASALLSGT